MTSMGRKKSTEPKDVSITFRVDGRTADFLNGAAAAFREQHGIYASTPQWCRGTAVIEAGRILGSTPDRWKPAKQKAKGG